MSTETYSQIRLERYEPEPNTGCWLWMGWTVRGYGRYGVEGRLAHRLFYETYVGPIPDGLVIDHICRVRSCVNPAHMRVVTSGENVLCGVGPSAESARKTHCVRGHAFDDSNTQRPANAKNRVRRVCRTCKREMARTIYARQHGSAGVTDGN